MALIVKKFGGTSVADIKKIRIAAQIILQEINSGNQVVIIVSAMAGVTNSLITLGHEITGGNDIQNDAKKQEHDALLSTGEIVTSALIAMELQNHNIKAQSMQAWQVGIVTNSHYGNALVNEIKSDAINHLLHDNVTPIITGFQGVTCNNRVTTLGLGGSDTSAALIAASMKADRLDIYTDVDGIFSADPRIVHNAKKLNIISNEEMLELSTSGAKVLHPRAALCAMRYKLNMRILSSFEPTKNGTNIVPLLKLLKIKNMENTQIKAITSNQNLIKVTIKYGTNYGQSVSEIYKYFTKNNININEIHNNEAINAMTIIANLDEQMICDKICSELMHLGFIDNYEINNQIATISIIGYGLQHDINLKWDILQFIREKEINILHFTSSELNITIFIHEDNMHSLLNLLHDKLVHVNNASLG